MDLTKKTLYIPLLLIVLVLVFIYYKNENKTFLSIVNSNKKNKNIENIENYSNKQNLDIIKNIPRFNQKEDNMEECIKKIREKKAESFNRMVNTNQIMFDIQQIKENKNKNDLTRTQKIASLNCSYFDLDNDALNKTLVPQNNELFIN